MISLLSRHISNDIIAVCANLLYDIMFVRPDRNHGKCICEEGVIIPVCVLVCVCSWRDCNTQIQALQFNETISCSLQNYKPIIINMVILQKLVAETPLGTPITVITNIIQSSSEMIMLNNILDPI